MEFRITNIDEIKGASSLNDELRLELESVQGPQEASSAGRYQPTAHLTAIVPYSSEFYNAVIGMRVSFGVPAQQPLAAGVYDGFSGKHYKHGQAPVGTPPELIDPPNASWLKDKINQTVTAKDTSVVYVLLVQFPSGAVVTDPGLAEAPPTVFADAAARRVVPNPNFGKHRQFFSYNLEPKAGEAPLSIAPDVPASRLNETWTKTAADLQNGIDIYRAVESASPASNFNGSEQAYGDAERAKTEMKKSLLIILELLSNSALVKELNAYEYQVDTAEILKASGDLQPSWKFHQELKAQPTKWSSGPVPAFVDPGYKFFDKPKQSELVEASTKSEEPVEPHYMVDYKKYPASYVEGLVRADVLRKAKLEFEFEIQKQMAKSAAEMYRVRAEFEKSDKVHPALAETLKLRDIRSKNESKQ